MRTALFWDITQGVVVVSYRPIGPFFKSKEYKKKLPLKMGPIGSPATSVRNYHYLLYNNPEKHSYRIYNSSLRSLAWSDYTSVAESQTLI